MKHSNHRYLLAGAVGVAIVATLGALPAQTGSRAEAFRRRGTEPGDPLPDLSPSLQALFDEGEERFLHEFTAEEGLGPLYNERACQTCHGGLGGPPGGPDPEGVGSQFNVTHFGLNQDGLFNPLRAFGGPVIQKKSIQDTFPGCPIAPETVPPFADVVSIRHTPPVFGFGLIDAIPDSEILSRENLGRDGVHGIANWGIEPQALQASATPANPQLSVFGAARVGRFGWKAQTATLEQFSAEPFGIELGVTNVFFPQEFTPAGLRFRDALPAECQLGPAPVDDPDQSQSFALYHFQALLAPPPRLRLTGQARAGEALFNAIGCDNCHTPEMRTSRRYYMETDEGVAVRVPQLENQTVHLYSDLLIHDMGPGLADNGGVHLGRTMGRARGNMWRTTPLWGARFKNAYLHDGRTSDLREAILAHGGEGWRSRQRFAHLPRHVQDKIIAFLNSI